MPFEHEGRLLAVRWFNPHSIIEVFPETGRCSLLHDTPHNFASVFPKLTWSGVMTASSFGYPNPTLLRRPSGSFLIRSHSRKTWSGRSATLLCSRLAFGKTQPEPCCYPDAFPVSARLCGCSAESQQI